MMNNKTIEPLVERLSLGMVPGLVAIAGPLRGGTFYLDEPVVSIGRLESNDICLEDPFVSRHHCLIRNEGDGYMIEDLTSANGTFINGERVNSVPLGEGSLIEIGGSRFEFRLRNSEETMALSQNVVIAETGRSLLDKIRLG
jgi:pSer/pThr/pTyr-binding forkhead associated (FHA) protein